MLTAAEFEAFIKRPENQERRFELINGEIIEKPLFSELEGVISVNIGGELYRYLQDISDYRTTLRARYRPKDDIYNDRLVDIAVVSNKYPIERYSVANFMPEICIEIQMNYIPLKLSREKSRFYVLHGAKFALIIYPHKQLIELSEANGETMLLTDKDLLTFGDLLPGFSVPVARFFPTE